MQAPARHAQRFVEKIIGEAVKAGKALKSPLNPDDSQVLLRGKVLFERDCMPCHGVAGRGDGVVPKHGFPPPPSLLAAHAKGLPDGYIYNYISRGGILMPEKSREDIEKSQSADFQNSEDNAKYAALNYLKYPKAVTVEKVNDPGPSVGKLEVGDAIEAVDGTKVAAVEEFSKLLKTTKPDQEIVVDFRRKNGPPGTARIKLGKNGDRDYGYLGIAVLDAPWVPFTIDFNLANVGGPSAGMVFSLAVIDKLTTGDLNGGKFVAGTGTIGADGRVGPIGGITHKMSSAQEAGAEVFLVPADNCDEARAVHGDTMKLVKVETLPQAVDALKVLNSGGKPPLC